jgi:3-hydroxyisobutyrate dehydrogenase-like beta-hydroxyacid dehydrogenase
VTGVDTGREGFWDRALVEQVDDDADGRAGEPRTTPSLSTSSTASRRSESGRPGATLLLAAGAAGGMDIGLVGVGDIGRMFVERLRDADHGVRAFDVDPDAMAYAAERGCETVEGPGAAARGADALVLALPGREEVAATLDALDGAGLVVDTSTVGPEPAARFADRRGDYLTAPLTQAAPNPGVHMICGGEAALYERANDLLDVLSDEHRRVGDASEAQSFKLAIQLRYAGRQALDAEVVAFCREQGADPELMNEYLGMDVDRDYFSGAFGQDVPGLGTLAIWNKDVGYAVDTARQTDTALPISESVHDAYKATSRVAGETEQAAATLIRHWNRLNGRETGERGQGP